MPSLENIFKMLGLGFINFFVPAEGALVSTYTNYYYQLSVALISYSNFSYRWGFVRPKSLYITANNQNVESRYPACKFLLTRSVYSNTRTA